MIAYKPFRIAETNPIAEQLNRNFAAISKTLESISEGEVNEDDGGSEWDYQAGGGTIEAWHWANIITSGALATAAIPALQVLYAVPFIAPKRTAVLNALAIAQTVNGGAGSRTRLGLYTNKAPGNLYPDMLVSGTDYELVTDAGGASVKTAVVNATLEPGALYWAAALVNNIAGPTVRVILPSECSRMLGTPNTLGSAANIAISVAKTYSALPTAYPNGAAYLTAGNIPAIAYRLAS